MNTSAAIPSPDTAPPDAKPKASETVRCAHCTLPVPKGLIEAGEKEQFCCAGCRGAFAVIHGSGLDDYYRLRQATGGTADASAVAAPAQGFSSFDTDTFQQLHVQHLAQGLCAADLRLEGVHCAACVWLIEKLPRLIRVTLGHTASQGIVEARLSMRQATVRVVWDPACIKLSEIAQALHTLGYRPHPAKGLSRQALRRKEERKQLMNIGLAGALAGNIMLLAIAQYAGLWGGIERQYDQLFRWLGAGLGLLALLGPGRVFFRGAVTAIRVRSPHLDLPIALALGVGGLAGATNVVMGRGDIYFDSLAVLVFLLLVGRYIQFRQQRSADDAVSLLASLTPGDCRRRLDDGTCEVVPIESLQVGDTVEVLPNGVIPADGEVVEGRASVVAALLTGESQPIPVKPGDAVCAGTQVVAQTIALRVTCIGEQTRVGRLMSLVSQGVAAKPAIVLLADRIAGWFVVAVSLIAFVVFAAWSVVDVGLAVDHTVALLIVACPCALGLATPLTIAVAIGRAAKRDILIKSPTALERAARGGRLMLDKTGTITTGAMRLIGWEGDTMLRRWVAMAEAQSTHPIAVALASGLCKTEADDMDTPAHTPVQVTQHPDGVVADTPAGKLAIGSLGMMQRIGATVSPHWRQRAEHHAQAGHTPVFIAVDLAVAALAWVGDGLHDDAAASIKQARRWGWQVQMLSGDRPEIARHIAGQVGIADDDARGDVTPETKLDKVRSAQQSRRDAGSVVMVGDGVNDAAALAAADLGVAVSGGAEPSLAAADVYLARPGLSSLIELFALGRQTLRTIRRNLVFSLLYNACVIALAAAGMITPLLAAVLMPLSSAAVLALAMGGQWHTPNPRDSRE